MSTAPHRHDPVVADPPPAPVRPVRAPIIPDPPPTGEVTEYRVIGALPVQGTAPGGTFTRALPPDQEARLIAAGHIEPVTPTVGDATTDTEGAG